MNYSPMEGVLYGITHRVDNTPMIREVKLLKIGIGLPKGPALNVWMQKEPGGAITWKMMRGYKGDDTKTAAFTSRAAAEAKFWEALPSAPVCPYPRKLAYFTFTKPTMVNGKEQYVPDFDAIEAHGPTPTVIDIVLLDDSPFSGAYQMWSSSELRCKGDGVNAMRVVTLAETPEEKESAKLSQANSEKFYPIMDGCWTCGCRYSLPTQANGKEQPSLCKPGGDLRFQLACNLRVGGTAFFHTTGFRSISGIFSSLYRVQMLTGGRLQGVPLKMVLRPFRTNHNGQAATQYSVHVEFHAPDVDTLRQRLLENAFAMRAIATGEPAIRLIDAPEGDTEDEIDDSPMSAAAMVAEFAPQADGEPAPEPPTPAAAATQATTDGLAEKLKAQAEKTRTRRRWCR